MDELIKNIIEELEKQAKEFERLSNLIEAPEIMADTKYLRHLIKLRGKVEAAAEFYYQIKIKLNELELIKTEPEAFYNEISILENDIDKLCKDAAKVMAASLNNSGNTTIIEIKAKDEESQEFASTLLLMYKKFAEENFYLFTVSDIMYTNTEKLSFAMVKIEGQGVYERLKSENGIHTAMELSKKYQAEVYVYPFIAEEGIELKEKDLRIDIFHSGGPGGQNVNKVASAVRITHIPSGIAVACQEERSQLKNKERAFEILKEKLKESNKKAVQNEKIKIKKQLIKDLTRIRSYDYKQGIVKDIRVNSDFNLNEILSGELNSLIDTIIINR